MSELTFDDKKAYIEKWCKKNKLELAETKSSFGKPLLVIGDYTFDFNKPILVAFEWWDEELLDNDNTNTDSMSNEEFELFDKTFGRLDKNGDVYIPSLHYDKSYIKYVQLSDYDKDEAINQMFDWVVWFVDNKFKVKRRNVSKEEYNKLTSLEYQVTRKYSDLPITYLTKGK